MASMENATVEPTMARVDLPVSTLGMLLVFGPLVLTWVLVELAVRMAKRSVSETTMTVLRSGSVMAAVLCCCYVCENHFPNPHLEKTENPSMYWGSFAVLILVALFTVRKSSMSDFMHRDQTEEWKGWMQFLFLAYHYWKMESNYNDIRVYITCYLWMTGFGNFSFFYMKQDFSLIRVIQMVWRMNFFVFFLCLTMNNPYIVYYICPLHTFFFFVTYSTMALWSSVNRSQYGAAVKVVVAAVLLYLVYDVIPRSFHLIFSWLGTTPTHASIGAHGTEWEWYFRSFLDHFSTVWGMVFALNMPFLSEWYKQVESFSARREWGIKLSVLGVLVVISAVWVKYVYMQGKTGYNSIHSYYGIIPLLAYLFLRNISVTVRSYYLHALHIFGTITLESYLLQYHVWLADNAGMLLNIIPGYPILNYCAASCLHIFCAFQMFHVTTTLRSVFVPSDIVQALRNLALLAAALASACCASILILRCGMNVGALVMIVGTIGGVATGNLLQRPDQDEVDLMPKVVDSTSVKDGVKPRGMLLLCGFAIVVFGSFLLHAEDFVLQKESAMEGEVKAMMPKSLLQLESSEDVMQHLESLTSKSLIQLQAKASIGVGLFADSTALGAIKGFVIGSLAQPWHGLVAVLAILLCVVTNDPFFGLARLTQALMGPNGQKSVSYEQAYGPLLEKLGERKRHGDSETAESAPLIPKVARAASAY
jgi:hypothetical protein